MNEHDLEASMIYLIDLLKHGYIIDTPRASHVITLLLKAEGTAKSKQDLLKRLMGKDPGNDLSVWKVSDFQTDWLEQQEPELSQSGENALSILFEQALTEAERARDSEGLDEWVLRKKVAEGLLKMAL